MPFRSVTLILAALLAALPTEPVHAQTGEASAKKAASTVLPIAPDRPGRWREAIFLDDPHRYRCLRGPASTALCAIANRMTCETYWGLLDDSRDGLQFCRNAYVHLPVHVDRDYVNEEWALALNYRIEAVRTATVADIEAARRKFDWAPLTPETRPKVGDFLVTVFRRRCGGPPPCPDPLGDQSSWHPWWTWTWPYETRATYALRQEGALWRLVWWPWERPDPVEK